MVDFAIEEPTCAGLDSLSGYEEGAVYAPQIQKGWSRCDTMESMANDARKMPVNLGVQQETLSNRSQNLGKIEASYLDDAVEEVSNWTRWLWDQLNPSSSDSHASEEEIARLNKDGTANPFSQNRQILSANERNHFRQRVREMNELLDRMKELLEEDQFELLMNLIIQESIRGREEIASYVQEQLLRTYKKRKRLNKERLEETQKYLQAAREFAWWGQFEQCASTIGLTLAAAATAGSGNWGVVALCYALGTAFNQWQGNPIESALARAIGWTGTKTFGANPKAIKENCFAVAKIGGGLFNLAITFTTSGTHYIGTMMEGAMQLVNVHVKTKCDWSEARLFKLDHDFQKQQRSMASHIKRLGSQFEKKVQDQKRTAALSQTQEEVTRQFFRS